MIDDKNGQASKHERNSKLKGRESISSESTGSSFIGGSSSSSVFVGGGTKSSAPVIDPSKDLSSVATDVNRRVDEYIEVALESVAVKVEALYKERMVLINQSEKKLTGMINQSTKMLGQLEGQLNAAAALTNESVKTQGELQEEIKYIKGNAISALAIFVSFFAFITVTLNVFSKAGSVVSAAVLVLIFWCLLIGFNLIIAIQFKVLSNSRVIWFSLGGVIFISIAAVVGLYYFSPELRGVKIIFQFA